MLLLIFFNVNFYLFLALPGLCCCPGFSLVVERGLLSVARVSHCSDFSCRGAQALGLAGFSSGGPWALEHRLSSGARL